MYRSSGFRSLFRSWHSRVVDLFGLYVDGRHVTLTLTLSCTNDIQKRFAGSRHKRYYCCTVNSTTMKFSPANHNHRKSKSWRSIFNFILDTTILFLTNSLSHKIISFLKFCLFLQQLGSMAPLKVESLEDLLIQIIANYQQVSTVPSGLILRNPYTNSDGGTSLHLFPLCSYEIGYPKNFGEFYSGKDSQKKHSMTKGEAFAWFARSRLRYSCSTLVSAFSKFLIPKLKEKGVSSLYSKTIDEKIDLSNLEIYEVTFTPTYQHTVELDLGFMKRAELVEPLMEDGLCHHTVLKCSLTGAIVDLTLGQFTGTVAPYVFPSLGSFISVVPGHSVETHPCSEESIQQQIARDESHTQISPDATPRLFALRVIHSLREKKPLCWKCSCPSSSKKAKLMRCSRCKEAMYCSKECQVLSWRKGHKDSCTLVFNNQAK